MIQIQFDKSDFNDIYLPYIDNPNRFLVFYGGGGSGKSVFIAQRYLYKCLKEPYFRLAYCRKIARTIRYSQFQLFKDLINKSGMNDFFQIKEGTMEIVCINGNSMLALGLDDREKIKSLQDPTDIWCEESTEFQKEDIMQLDLRLRTTKSKVNQLILSFNPISIDHWLYEAVFIKNAFKAEILKTTYLDNNFLPDEYKQRLESYKDLDENYYKVYCLGEWGGHRKGAIYNHYQLTDHIPQFAEIIYGLDFGFNHPTSLVRVGIIDRVAYVEEVLYKSGLTTQELIQELRNAGISNERIYADAARPDTIEEIYREGFDIHPADKDVLKGIDTVKSVKLNILENSPNLLKEIRTYKWAEDKNGNIQDKPVKVFDDAMDSMRYAIHSHLSQGTGTFSISII